MTPPPTYRPTKTRPAPTASAVYYKPYSSHPREEEETVRPPREISSADFAAPASGFLDAGDGGFGGLDGSFGGVDNPFGGASPSFSSYEPRESADSFGFEGEDGRDGPPVGFAESDGFKIPDFFRNFLSAPPVWIKSKL